MSDKDQEQQEQGQEQDEQPQRQVSSMMDEPTYDAATTTCTIKMKKGGTYEYANFTAEQFKEFHSAKSWGKYFHANPDLFANGVRVDPTTETLEEPEPEKVEAA